MDEYVPKRKEYEPRMHSAEHILNQTMVRMFNCGRAFSAHIEKKKSKCDYHFDRNLTLQEITELEGRINDIIKQNLSITERMLSREEATKIISLHRLPQDAGDSIRIIEIGNYDICPCSGQHATRTNELGEFKIISTDFNNSVLRVRFKLVQGLGEKVRKGV